MRIFEKKPKAGQQITSTRSQKPAQTRFGRDSGARSILQLQRTIGNQAFMRLFEAEKEQFGTSPGGNASKGLTREPGPVQRHAKGPENTDKTASFHNKMEHAFGIDRDTVPVVTHSQSARELNVNAYTDGRSIHLGGQMNEADGADHARLAHEYAHIAQQRMGLVNATGSIGQQAVNTDPALEEQADAWARQALRGERPIGSAAGAPPLQSPQPVIQGEDLYTVAVHQDAFIHGSPLEGDFLPANYVELKPERVKFIAGTEVSLINSRGRWLEVIGTAYDEHDRRSGEQRGWILRSQTNLAPAGDAATENDRIAQDLDDFLDQYLLPTLHRWKAAIRVQGNAYLTAYTNFDTAIQEADEQRKTEAEFFGAILTTVCVGGFGFFGDIVQTGERLQRLFSVSERTGSGLGGSIEDAIQSVVGESIDIAQGGWYQRLANTEMHPSRYLTIHLAEMDDLIADSQQHVGETKSRIRRSATAFDRPQVLTEIFHWWNQSIVSNFAPRTTETEEAAMAQEMEKGFWIKYMFKWGVRPRDFGAFGGQGHEYQYLPRSFEEAFDRLGVRDAAGISEWNRGLLGSTLPHLGTGTYPVYPYEPGWEGTAHGSTRELERPQAYTGAASTAALIRWMRGYRLQTFD